MPSLWFIVPAHGRAGLTKICLDSLRWTCDELKASGIDASAVVIADDENLDTAHELGFWGYEQDNSFLGRKFNDGYELAAKQGVAYVVPLGSDDWIHPSLITERPLEPDHIRCARKCVMVAEEGARFMRLQVMYEGGLGMRIMPTGLLKALGGRPADEDRPRGIDTNTLMKIKGVHRVELDYCDVFDFQIVDFKTAGSNLNTWEMCRKHASDPENDPWPSLLEHYPATSVAAMKAYYAAAGSVPAEA